MSMMTWTKEFYPRDAHETRERDALSHSLRKWKGLRASALEKHGLAVDNGDLIEPGAVTTVMSGMFEVNDVTCALCHHHIWKRAGRCGTCPLYAVRGGPCDQALDGEEYAPYRAWTKFNDPEPMIASLEAAVAAKKAKK